MALSLYSFLWSLSTLSLAIAQESNCVDKAGSAISTGTSGDEFYVSINTNCINSSITLDITYDGYHGNWFGIVFAESMTAHGVGASALVYTVGKVGHSERPMNLYSYSLTTEELNASGVNYDGEDSDPTQIFTQTINNSIQLIYSWTPPHSVINQSNIPFMWARGNATNDHWLSYHKEGTADAPVTIDLTSTNPDTTTSAPVTPNITPENVTEVETTEVISTMPPPAETTEVMLECGYIILDLSSPDQLARPLDICTTSNARNESITESMMITCDNNVYTHKVFDDDSCNGTVVSIGSIGDDCIEGVECVCGVGLECDYAVWLEYIYENGNYTMNETCTGDTYVEKAAVLNECINGRMYGCVNETLLEYEGCDGEGLNITGNLDVCDMECFEGENVTSVPVSTVPTVESTEMTESTEGTVPAVESTEGTSTTERTPAPTVGRRDNQTAVYIGVVIGVFFFVLIVIGIGLWCVNMRKEDDNGSADYGAVGGNDTDVDTDVELANTTR